MDFVPIIPGGIFMDEIVGRYQILNEVGSGGMGVVYRARDKNFQRDVALKLLPRHLTKDESFIERFRREAQVVGQLEHPHIVPVYDVGMHDDQPFLVMRLLNGGTLRDRMRDADFDMQGLLKVMTQVASALDVAHKRRIVHRDLKPSNILFDEMGTAFLSDFGIAKVLDAATQLTGTGMVGTPTYMSPEQFTGQTEVTGRSDQYALAVVIFEALAGRLPFEGTTTAQVMFQHISQPPPDLHLLSAKYPPEMSAVLRRALAKNPQDRFPTVTAMVEALQSVANRYPTAAVLPVVDQTVIDSPSPYPAAGYVAGAAAAGAAYTAGTAAAPQAGYGQYAPAEATRAAKTGVRTPPEPVQAAQMAATGATASRAAEKPASRRSPVVPILIGIGLIIFLLLVLGGVGYGAYALFAGGDETPTTTPTVVAVDPEGPDDGEVVLLGASGLVRVAGSTAQYRPAGSQEFISLAAGEEVPLVPGTVFRAGNQPLELVLPDETEIALDANSEIEFESVAVEGEADETSLVIMDGRLLLNRLARSGAPVLLKSPLGAVFRVNDGPAGVVFRAAAQLFRASCLGGSCLFTSGGDTLPLSANEGTEAAGSGAPGGVFVAAIEDFCDLAPENPECAGAGGATATHTATATPTPTGEATASATATPGDTPEPEATATATTAPASSTPAPTNTSAPPTNTPVPPTNTPFVPTNTPVPPPTQPPPTQPPPPTDPPPPPPTDPPPPPPTYTPEPP